MAADMDSNLRSDVLSVLQPTLAAGVLRPPSDRGIRAQSRLARRLNVRTSLISLLVVCGIGVCSIGTAAAQAAGPPAGYNIEEKYTDKSPDGIVADPRFATGVFGPRNLITAHWRRCIG